MAIAVPLSNISYRTMIWGRPLTTSALTPVFMYGTGFLNGKYTHFNLDDFEITWK